MAPEEEPPERMRPGGSDRSGKLDVEAYLNHYGVEYRIKQDGTRTIYNLNHCLFDPNHTKNEAAIIQDTSGLTTYQCFHDSCKGYTWHDARPKISGEDSLAAFLEGHTRTEPFEGIAPLDIFGGTSLVGEPDLPLDVLPEVIADFAEDEAERLGVQPSMVGMPCVVAAAGATTDKYRIQPKQHDTRWLESARPWIANVANIGEGKTPAQRKAFEPLERIEADLYQKYVYEQKMYEREIEAYKSTSNKDISERPEPPIEPRIIVNDATIEALSDILVANPKGVVCIHDELSGWFGAFDAYRSTKSASMDRPAWIRLYDGGPQGIDRVRRGRVWVSNWSASIYGGIQPGPMQRLMGKITDDGLVQRFIIFYGRKTGPGKDRAPNYSVITAYRETITHLTKMEPFPGREVIRLSPEAQQYFQLVSETAERVIVLPDTSDAFRGHLSKWKGMFARLLLTYHITEAAARKEEQPPEYVSGDTAAKVAKLMLDFLLPNAARFYVELIGENNHLAHARWIAGYILSRELEKITRRDIYRAYNELRDDPDGITRAMLALTMTGWVTPPNTQKRDYITLWQINPAVHSIFAERAKAERQRREEEKRKIQEAVKFLGLAPYKQKLSEVSHEPI